MDSWRRPSVPHLAGRGPEPRLRDTASGQIKPAAAGPEQGPATIYACGITPYDATHIGHAATFTAWDLLIRAWLDAGRPGTYVQNVTDADDPLPVRAGGRRVLRPGRRRGVRRAVRAGHGAGSRP